MKKVLLCAAITFVMACKSPAIRTDVTDNTNIQVDFLFEHDGCKVYRFQDGTRWVYYTNCNGSTTEIHTEHRGSGKHGHSVEVRTESENQMPIRYGKDY